VRKMAFLRCHLYRKPIILPRQARDKHRESTQNRCRLSQAEGGSWRMLRETPATLLSANGNLPAAPQTHHAPSPLEHVFQRCLVTRHNCHLLLNLGSRLSGDFASVSQGGQAALKISTRR
jgi:hypothetical protein